jgi:predicted enzyme related to lactoylglutathione lyase
MLRKTLSAKEKSGMSETINYVEYPAKDIEATKQFFSTAFGRSGPANLDSKQGEKLRITERSFESVNKKASQESNGGQTTAAQA